MSGLETLRKASDLLTPERVVTALDGALSSWRDPRSSIREDLRLQHPVFSAEILDLGCDLGLRQWTASALALLRSREVREPCRVPRVTAVWLAGSIPIATLAALIPPLLAGSAVYAKPSSADPVSARLFRESLMRADEEVGRSLAIGEDERVLAQADAVVVHGRDETLAELRARVPIDRIFVGYGHRLSVAAIGPETEIREAARAAALDVPAEFPKQKASKVYDTVLYAHSDLEKVTALVEASPALANATRDLGFGE